MISEKLGEEYHEFIQMNWKRYLDDCLIIWSKEESNLNIVYIILNTLDPDIKFTMEKSSSQIPFLDVLVSIRTTTNYLRIYFIKVPIPVSYTHLTLPTICSV